MSEWVGVAMRQLSNCSAISWQEQVNFQRNDGFLVFIMATSFSGGRSRSTRREPPTMGKKLERKVKPKENPFEYKKRIVLDQEKSKQSLGEIYEQEYLKQQQVLYN
jgi:hypothetical protein